MYIPDVAFIILVPSSGQSMFIATYCNHKRLNAMEKRTDFSRKSEEEKFKGHKMNKDANGE